MSTHRTHRTKRTPRGRVVWEASGDGTWKRSRVRNVPSTSEGVPRPPEHTAEAVSGPLDPVRDIVKKNPARPELVRSVLDPLVDLINRAPKVLVVGALVYWLAPGVLAGVIARPRRRRR